MRPGAVAISCAAVAVAAVALWLATERPPAGERRAGADAGETRREEPFDPRPASPRESPSARAGTRRVGSETGAGVARSDDTSGAGRAPEAPVGAVDDVDRPERPEPLEDDLLRRDFERFARELAALRAIARETGAGVPLDETGLGPTDAARLDLDGDGTLSAWELESSAQLLARAERHPVKSDLGDGAYPIARDEYARPEWEFDAIDSNRDGELDVDEQYEFLLDAAKTTVLLDRNGDGGVDFDESGLSPVDFAPLDRNGDGQLDPWEMRWAIALGAIEPPAD